MDMPIIQHNKTSVNGISKISEKFLISLKSIEMLGDTSQKYLFLKNFNYNTQLFNH